MKTFIFKKNVVLLSSVLVIATIIGLTPSAAGAQLSPRVPRVPHLGPCVTASTLPNAATSSTSVSSNVVPQSSSVSGSSTTTPCMELQQRVEQQINIRLLQLSKLTARVNASATLTTTDKSALDNLLSNETSGMETLLGEVQATTDRYQLQVYARSMIENYRVFMVMSPQVELTMAKDRESYVELQIAAVIPEIQAAITTAQQQGLNVGSAEATLQNLNSALSQADSDTASATNNVLEATPQGYPGNKTIFVQARNNLVGGVGYLHTVRNDFWEIIKDIRKS
ncbi:MAG: hypothetical protein M1483_07940 [Actinobacteria bacterium]|nr:hypothetical protein [Actinomycetota bacterium]MCL6105540.1 hypothetical protein [Actinomycetota bacterium]